MFPGWEKKSRLGGMEPHPGSPRDGDAQHLAGSGVQSLLGCNSLFPKENRALTPKRALSLQQDPAQSGKAV